MPFVCIFVEVDMGVLRRENELSEPFCKVLALGRLAFGGFGNGEIFKAVDVNGHHAPLVSLNQVEICVHGLPYGRWEGHMLCSLFGPSVSHIIPYEIYHRDVSLLGLFQCFVGIHLMDSKVKFGVGFRCPESCPQLRVRLGVRGSMLPVFKNVFRVRVQVHSGKIGSLLDLLC